MSAGRHLVRIRSIAAAVGVGAALTAGAGHALADTDDASTHPDTTAVTTAETSSPSTTSESASSAPSTSAGTTSSAPVSPTSTPPRTTSPSTTTTAPTTTAPTTTAASRPSSDDPTPTRTTTSPDTAATTTTTTTTVAPPPASSITPPAQTTTPAPTQATSPARQAPSVARVDQTLQVAPAPAPTPPPTTVPTQIVLGLLGLFGYNPYATPNPAAPAPAPILEQIWVGWQQINRRLFNSHPTVSPTVTGYDPTTGTVTGTIGGYDPDGDALRYTASSPAHGTLTVDQATGTFVYTPNAAYAHELTRDGATGSGTDTITFTASDDLPVNGFHLHLLSATAPGGSTRTVSIPVVGRNTAPTGMAVGTLDSATGTTTYVVTASDSDGDPVTIAVTQAPTRGSLALVNGAYVYTPTTAAAHAAAGGGTNTDTAVLTLTDGHGGASTLLLAPTILGVNAAPVVTVTTTLNDGKGTQPAGTSSVVVAASDPDGDPLTITVTTGPTHGTLTQTGSGTYLYTPDPTYAHGLSGAGSDSAVVTVTDGFGGATSTTASFVITPANTNPVGVVVSSTQTSNTVTTYVISFTDADGDTVTRTVTTAPRHGTFDLATGVYTADAAYAHSLSVGGSTTPGSDRIVVSFDDGHGGSGTLTLTPTILPVNSAPSYLLASYGNAGIVSDFDVRMTDPDGDPITTTATTPAHGTVAVSPFTAGGGYNILYFADEEFAKTIREPVTDTFDVTFDDGHGGTVTKTYVVQVPVVNVAPTIALASSSTTGGSVTTYVITTGDSNGDPVTVSVGSFPSLGSVANINGGWVYTPGAGVAHQLAAGGATTPRQDTFTLVATDSRGAMSTLTLTPTITPVNSAPTITIVSTTTDADGTIHVTFSVSDSDAGDQPTLRVEQQTGSAGVKGSVTNANYTSFTYTPERGYAHGLAVTGTPGTDLVTISADDGFGGRTSLPVELVIAPQNIAPDLTLTPALLSDGTTVIVKSSFDRDFDSVTETVTAPPKHGTITVNERGYLYTPDAAYVAGLTADSTDSVTITADDGHGGRTAVTVDLTIVAPPTTSVTLVSTSGGTSTYSVTTRSGSTPAFQLVSATNGMPTATSTGFVFTPDATYAHSLSTNGATTPGSGSVVVAVPDGRGGNTIITVKTVIAPTNTAPTISVVSSEVYGQPTSLTNQLDVAVLYSALINGGKTLLVADAYGQVRLVDVGTGIALPDSFFYTLMDGSPTAAGSSASKDVAAIVDATGALYVYFRGELRQPVTAQPTTSVVVTTDRSGFPVVIAAHPTTGRVSFTNPVLGTGGSLNLGGTPSTLIMSADESTVYAVDRVSGMITVIDVATQRGAQFITGLPNITAVAVSPDKKTLYVGGPLSMRVVDIATGTVTKTVQVLRGDATALAVSPDGSRLYAKFQGMSAVEVLDTTTLQVVDSTPAVGVFGGSVAVAPGGRTLIVTGDGGIVKIPVSPVYRVVTSDADSDSVTVSVTGQPRNGVVAPLGNGTWAYTSTSNGAPDSFTLTATDGHGGSTSATRVV